MDQVDNVDNRQPSPEPVDGYSDVTEDNAENLPDPADPGTNNALKPMDAEERAKAEAEIRKDERENHPGDLGH